MLKATYTKHEQPSVNSKQILRLVLVMTGCHESQFQSQSSSQQTVTITLIWDPAEQRIKDLM